MSTIVVYLLLSKKHLRSAKKVSDVMLQCETSFHRFNFDIDGEQRQLLAAFRAFSLIVL
jgi:hypothetical protein